MALSNWDTLAFDADGKPCVGVVVNGNGSVEIYKNFLYVYNKKMFKKGEGSYTNNVIAQIESGNINISKFSIIAKRHKEQNSIFVRVAYTVGDEEKYFVGIGCYGFINTARIYAEKMGLDTSRDWVSGSSYDGDKFSEFITCFEKEGVETHTVPKKFLIDQENQWIGVSDLTFNAFLDFLEELRNEFELSEEYLNKIKNIPPLRYNQGDAFFAKSLDKEITATEIGESSEPIFTKVIRSMK